MRIRETSKEVNITQNIATGSEGDWVIINFDITIPVIQLNDMCIRWIFPGGVAFHKTIQIGWENTTDEPRRRIHFDRNIKLI
ncbi:hypothetical protein FKM82_021450 [Ascaphus truei]